MRQHDPEERKPPPLNLVEVSNVVSSMPAFPQNNLEIVSPLCDNCFDHGGSRKYDCNRFWRPRGQKNTGRRTSLCKGCSSIQPAARIRLERLRSGRDPVTNNPVGDLLALSQDGAAGFGGVSDLLHGYVELDELA